MGQLAVFFIGEQGLYTPSENRSFDNDHSGTECGSSGLCKVCVSGVQLVKSEMCCKGEVLPWGVMFTWMFA